MIMLSSLKKLAPWYVKIIIKVLLTRLPFAYKFWKKISLFEHGDMERPDYAYSVLVGHLDRVKSTNLANNFVGLELGPGDSLSTALIAKAFGASRTYLVDAADFASRDVERYKIVCRYLEDQGHDISSFSEFNTVDQMLKQTTCCYLTNGLVSLKTIPDASVDFIWSQAVLEHVRKDIFFETICQLRRILKDDGVCSHQVDLKDHLNSALNNLRFNEKIWEANFFAGSGFYTNRIRYVEMVDMFSQAGFEVKIGTVTSWNTLPTRRSSLVEPYRSMDEDNLLVSGFDVLLQASAAK